jgi:large subunit ribosomal protein L4
MSTTLQANVYSQEGKEVSAIALPEKVFGVAWNADLVHEVVLSMQSNARANTAHTKDRSEVRGGGKKPWKQKGTGRARHGSSRSPIWSGGGVAHGPRNEREYGRKINKNARAKALACVLSQKYSEGGLILVDALTFATPKTAEARKFISALGTMEHLKEIATKKANAALIVLADRDEQTELSFRNFGNIHVMSAKDVNPVALLTYKYVVVAKPEEALKALEARVATKTVRKAITTS